MNSLSRRKILRSTAAAGGALALSVAGYAAPAAAAPASSGRAPAAVSASPAAGTPELVPAPKGGKDQIRQMVQCGGTIYAAGSFRSIVQHGTKFLRTGVFSFRATAPYKITSWHPKINGIVNSIAFNGPGCSNAYIGGDFSSVAGTAVKNIAKISTLTGAVQPGFGHSTSGGGVETLLAVKGHILAGGQFTSINGSSADPYMASLSPVTGKDDGFLHLHISGFYHYCKSDGTCTTGKNSYVYNQQLSHRGALDLVEGDFTSVGGLPRQQIFMLNLAAHPAKVTGWTSPEWDGSKGNLPKGFPYQCETNEAFYIRTAAWSPSDGTIYTASTGTRPWNVSASAPRSGLCDAVAAFPATHAPVLHKWVEYSGCDSYYSVAADNSAVYAAGHPRWAENPNGCNKAGPGAIPDHGLQGLAVSTGQVQLNKSGAALYTMSRSANADNMMITHAGLWISSTNRFGSQFCGGKPGHAGICFLRYSRS